MIQNILRKDINHDDLHQNISKAIQRHLQETKLIRLNNQCINTEKIIPQ